MLQLINRGITAPFNKHMAAAAVPTVDPNFVVETQTKSFPNLALDCGVTLQGVEVAFETYGQLNPERSNAILILHAFSGDAHAAGIHAQTGQPGWWNAMIGPGKAFDTDRYFVVCSNVLGGCQGTTGPNSKDPVSGAYFAMRFPVITVSDMVRLQKCLVESFGIGQLLAVAGGSMGGMQALEWAVAYPNAVASVICIAATSRHSAQQIAFNEVGRQAIMSDPEWNEGNYYDLKPPGRGLAIARMIGHITYMSDDSMREKFGRRLRDKDAFGYDFSVDFEVESYLRYRGSQFVTRFDPNSFLYITKAMDYFDLSKRRDSLSAVFENVKSRFLVLSFTSDWLYPTYQSLETVSALRTRGADVAFCELPSTYGHDAFLVESQEQSSMVAGFLNSVAAQQHEPAYSIAGIQNTDEAPAAEAIIKQEIAHRSDYAMIAELIPPESSALDLGCGEGELLAWLKEHKQVRGQGVEIDAEKIGKAIARGVSAYQSDIEAGLADYPDRTFDFVILSQTLQEMRHPLRVLREMLRVGRHAIVAFPNFGHWSTRLAHLATGRAPRTQLFPYDWFESPNLHFLTIKDFIDLCHAQNWIVERKKYVRKDRRIHRLPNLLAEVAVFSIRSA